MFDSPFGNATTFRPGVLADFPFILPLKESHFSPPQRALWGCCYCFCLPACSSFSDFPPTHLFAVRFLVIYPSSSTPLCRSQPSFFEVTHPTSSPYFAEEHIFVFFPPFSPHFPFLSCAFSRPLPLDRDFTAVPSYFLFFFFRPRASPLLLLFQGNSCHCFTPLPNGLTPYRAQ